MFSYSIIMGGIPFIQCLKYLKVTNPKCPFYHIVGTIKYLFWFCCYAK
jgi:hypothetical protein